MNLRFPFLLLLLSLMPAWAAHAQEPGYPTRVVRIVVGFSPGGAADTVARIVGNELSRELGQPVIVENRPGAGTTLASDHVARAAPDGYTLLLAPSNHYGPDQLLFKTVKYEGSKDFTAITRWSTSPLIVAVSKASGIRSIPQLVEEARRQPGRIFYASSGTGVITHQAGAYFAKATGTKLEHVPFNGGAPAIQAVAAGEAQLTFGTPPSVLPMVKAGRLLPLAVTSPTRSALLPETPTLAEQGVAEFDLQLWFGLFGPAKLPKPIVDRLFAASQKVLALPQVREKLEAQGNEAAPSQSPSEFHALAVRDGSKSRDLIRLTGAATE